MNELPNIPALNLVPEPPSQGSYVFYKLRKHLMMLNGQPQFNATKDQIQVKYKHLFDKQQKMATTQSQSTGEIYINITLYKLCYRCDRWILKDEQQVHLGCHAAIVLDNLLLGDKFCSQSQKQLLERLKVTHIVNAAAQLPNYLDKLGVKYIKLGLEDNMTEQLLPQQQYSKVENAHQQGGKVFVHCQMGKSRSVSVILIYLMRYQKMRIFEALEFVKKVRPIAQPNLNYMKQLKEYEQKFYQQIQKN